MEVTIIRVSHVRMVSPSSVREALQALDEYGHTMKIVAGSTDVSVSLKDGNLKEECLLDISYLDSLRFIKRQNGLIHLGALTTYADCIRSPTIQKNAHILIDTFNALASPQIRNLATVAGNLGNASPAGDAIPPLFVLNASVVLESLSGRRKIAIRDFFTGYRETERKPNELITEMEFCPVRKDEVTFFKKLGQRQANAIAIASIAFWGRITKGPSFVDTRISLGAVAPTVIRATGAEQALIKGKFTRARIREVSKLCSLEASPISDVRGSAEFRRRSIDGLAQSGFLEILESLKIERRASVSRSLC